MYFIKKILFVILFFMIAFTTTQTWGQSSTYPDVAKKIREMGNQLNPVVSKTTGDLYAPILAKAPKDGVKVIKDQTYGTDERNKLDIYQPAKSALPTPILVFVHGGGFVRGDKGAFANIGTYFARRGILTITINYRFAPKNKWPSGAEDLAAVLKWIRENGKKYAGDINSIFLMGTSAGAAHVSSYVFFENFQLKDGDGVAGAILMSCPTYDTSRLDAKMDSVYYGEDSSKYPAMSAIDNVDGRKIPLFMVVAELDMPTVMYQNRTMINALYERDKALPIIKVLIGHNHFSETAHINTKDESLGPDVLEFIKVNTGEKK
jgi:acetyl esterase